MHVRGATLIPKPIEDGMLAVIRTWQREGYICAPDYAVQLWQIGRASCRERV